MQDPDTVPLEVSYDENAGPVEIKYKHMIFGLMKLEVSDGIATLDPDWDRLADKSLKEGYDRWVTTGDVLRSVEQLSFIERIEAPHHAPKEVEKKEIVTDGGQPQRPEDELIALGECPNCGYVAGDDVEMIFPAVADCNKCGAELDRATVVDESEVQSRAA